MHINHLLHNKHRECIVSKMVYNKMLTDRTIREATSYLLANLGIKASARAWSADEHVPIYLRSSYRFYVMKLLNSPCILLVDIQTQEPVPSAIKKHIAVMANQSNRQPIYVRTAISYRTRLRLIGQNIPFIVPRNQMYLPFLAIDLRERFLGEAPERNRLTWSAQTVVLFNLLNENENQLNARAYSKLLNYSPMALTKAYDELESMGIGQTLTNNRRRIIQFPKDKRELWERSRRYMRSPVSRRLQVDCAQIDRRSVQSGMTALAQYTMLNAPKEQVYAINKLDRKWLIRESKKNHERDNNSRDCQLEVWGYSPQLFASQGVVDPISLYLSLQDNPDERVQQALKQMMERFQWFTD